MVRLKGAGQPAETEPDRTICEQRVKMAASS